MADIARGALAREGSTAVAQAPPPAPAPTPTPADELGMLVAWGAGLFYWAEADANPMVRSYWDALHYVATALSVGYANVFPVTPLGKAIGALVMTIGPALSARALDQSPRAAAAADENDGGTALLASQLDAIL